MIGVTYGAPTEYQGTGPHLGGFYQMETFRLKRKPLAGDIYVQLSFLMAMDKYGMNAPSRSSGDVCPCRFSAVACNMQARKNFHDSIFAPLSGSLNLIFMPMISTSR
jgi:hypothetical protein